MSKLSSDGLHWMQFRLSTVLWFVLVVALVVAYFVARHEADRLVAENRQLVAANAKLKADAGYLEVVDPGRVRVLQIPVLDELSWRWKVWLPPGNWILNCLTQGIPLQGIPDGASVGPVPGNREINCTATVRKGPDGKWHFRGSTGDSQIGNPLPESHRMLSSYQGKARMKATSCDTSGSNGPESFDPKDPIVLVRYRAHEIVTDAAGRESSKQNPQSSDGVMLWLTPVPAAVSQQGN